MSSTVESLEFFILTIMASRRTLTEEFSRLLRESEGECKERTVQSLMMLMKLIMQGKPQTMSLQVHILNEFSQTPEWMSEPYISKDNKQIWYSHPLTQQEALHHAIFYDKDLDHLILLSRQFGSILSPFMMFSHQNLLDIVPK